MNFGYAGAGFGRLGVGRGAAAGAILPAFPVPESSASGAEDVATLSHTIDMPASVAIGDVVLIFFRTGQTGAIVHTPPVDWDLVGSATSNGSRFSIYTKIADGSEGASITITTDATRFSSYISHRISGAHGDVSGTLAGTTINPPDHAPAWGSAKTLWFASCSATQSHWTFTSAPTDFGNLVQDGNASSTSGSRCRTGTANRDLEASSLDPGVFAATSGVDYISATVAVRPA